MLQISCHFKRIPGISWLETSENHTKTVILIGGLSDGVFFYSFSEKLVERLAASGFSTVSPFLSSIGNGFGVSSIQQDASELSLLISHLKAKGKTTIALLGHSTGCQSILAFIQEYGSQELSCAILQGAVSDPEYFQLCLSKGELRNFLPMAEKLLAVGKGEALLPREAFNDIPITARRYHSINSFGGEEDYFSHNQNSNTRRGLISRIQVPILFLFSEQDQFCQTAPETLGECFKALSEHISFSILKGADHAITNNECCQQDVFIQDCLEFLQENLQ